MTLVTRYWAGIKDHICREKKGHLPRYKEQGHFYEHPAASSANRVLLDSFVIISAPADVRLMGSRGQLPRPLHNFLTSLTFCLIY